MTVANINKSNTIQKIAAILAFLLGVLSVFAGGRVLLGIDTKDYNIINWLVIYNVVFGFISMVVAYFIWKQTKRAKTSSIFVFGTHFLVFLYLNFFTTVVASESIKAMLFRVSVWTLIIVLSVIIPSVLNKNKL